MTDAGLNYRVSVVIMSCDGYVDLWEPFFELFNRFWPCCPYQRYLVTDSIDAAHPLGCTLVAGGKNLTWSHRLLNALMQIETDYVLLLVDDLFLHSFVDTDRVDRIFCWGIRNEANCIRMNPQPGPDILLKSGEMKDVLGISIPRTLYRASTVFTFWKKEILAGLLDPQESIWDFEVFGTERSDRLENFYASRIPNFPNYNGVIKGLWRPDVIRRLRILGVKPDLTSRRMMTVTEQAVFAFQIFRSFALRLFPTRSRRVLKRLFSGNKYHYHMAE
jgi:hypothetical protein